MKLRSRLACAELLALSLPLVPRNLPAQDRSMPPRLLAVAPLLVARDAQQPIRIADLRVSAQIEGALARTTVDIRFANPNDRQLEGELQFPLDPDQQVSGFALDVDGHMRAAVPVPKQKGQEVFEAVERRRVDPGLLERTVGNQFKLRIYPIPAHGERRVRIVIDQSLRREGAGWQLRLPLAFARGLANVPLRVRVAGQSVAPKRVDGMVATALTRQGEDWVATLDGRSPALATGLVLRLPAASQPQAFVQDFDGARYFHAEVPLAGAVHARALPHTIGLLWDSSGSARHRDLAAELALLDRYFAAVGTAQVRLIRLRDVAEPARTFTVRNGDWSALRNDLQATVYDGASALADWQPQADVGEYLLFSDGLSNYGLADAMPKLAANQRLFAIDSAGADADAQRLSAWADAGGGRMIALQGMAGVAAAARELTTEGPRLLAIDGVGASDLVAASRYPRQGLLQIAGRLDGAPVRLALTVDEGGQRRRVEVPLAATLPASSLVAGQWAGYTMAALEADPERNAEAIRRLGARFGLVGPDTSLIVLENASDYARWDLPAPPELAAEVARLRQQRDRQQQADARAQLDKVRAEFAEKVAWWEKPWPKDAPPRVAAGKPEARGAGTRGMLANLEADRAPAAPAMAMPAPAPPSPAPSERVAAAGLRQSAAKDKADSGEGTGIRIAMQAWNPQSPLAARLRAVAPGQVYAVYLDERDRHADSAAFYLDVAAILFQRGQRALALRVLSNLAEMNLENRQLLRVLGYRLMEARDYAQAVRVFERVRQLAGNEPQSWRDLALAEAAAGREQAAVNHLWHVVAQRWDARFPSVELIALGELDALIARSRQRLDLHAIDPALRRNLPLDLRVVLSWDTDNTDIDLWVTDPNGEKTYYASPHSYQGGWLSHDCTQGYGPEEFILRHAKPGKYKVEANFFGDHSQLITGPTSLSLHLFTGFGTPQQKDQQVTLRLTDAKQTILVGEFEVK